MAAANGETAHAALHTAYNERRRINGSKISLSSNNGKKKQLAVDVCVGTCCYLKGSYDILQDLNRKLRAADLDDQVDIRATFCFENCGSGINVKVGDTLYSGMSPAKTGFLLDTITKELQSK